MSNSLKSSLATGVREINGDKAVLISKVQLIVGCIVMGIAGVCLLGGIVFATLDQLGTPSRDVMASSIYHS